MLKSLFERKDRQELDSAGIVFVRDVPDQVLFSRACSVDDFLGPIDRRELQASGRSEVNLAYDAGSR